LKAKTVIDNSNQVEIVNKTIDHLVGYINETMKVDDKHIKFKLYGHLKGAIAKEKKLLGWLTTKLPNFDDKYCFNFRNKTDYLYEHIYTFRILSNKDKEENCE